MLRSSDHASVYEAVCDGDDRAVIAKVFELAGDDVEARVEHEFALIEALDIEGVVKALALERVGDQLVLLLERVPGQDLAEYAERQPLALERFFSIAVQVAEVLGRVHAKRIIHRDLKPTNILIDPDSGRVHLADFGISVLLDAERRHIYDPAVVEGTLPYLSPEQTGRTGRSVDFRSDLYSLGVTFYELLTGRRPFEFSAPLDLIHAHLARTPDPPQSRRPDLPEGVSRMVLKLLEKAPEHRYQTALGLSADLRKLRELVELGQDARGLILGREDFPRSLQLPHQLYGRMQERHELVEELERVMRTGTARVVLLAGPSGVGKSALLANFEGPVAGSGGYLARGKFDAFHEAPYSAFIDAFGALVEQILTEREDRLERWRERLSDALGDLGRIVCDLVPTLELVLGEQPVVPELEPREARNRLHLAVGRLVFALCDAGQPLVMVLDDLHLADRSSLALLQSLIESGRRGALLILGTFVGEKLEPGDPLRALIEVLADHRRVRVTHLRELPAAAVESLLADTLGRPAPELRGLAQIVGRKTGNNPLFIRQFLAHLADRGLFRLGERGWVWDEGAVAAADIPDDVAEVMRVKLTELAEPARELLARAACVGTRFDMAALEIVSDKPRSELAPTLYELVERGLLALVGREYRFAHDRIRDAAYEQLPGPERRRQHWRIAQHERARAGEISEERLFAVVDHLDAGLPEAELDDSLRIELAALNLRAGTRALEAAAYDGALRYLDVGVELTATEREAAVERGQAAPHYALVVGLAFGRAQVLAQTRRGEEADEGFAELLSWPLHIADYGRIAARRVRLLTLADRPELALALAREALARCGHGVPREASPARVRVGLVRAWLSMRGRSTAQLIATPDCEDPAVGAAMTIVSAATAAAYVADPSLLMLLTGVHVRLFLAHGFHPTCAHALVQLALGVGPGLRRVDDAIRLCEQALALVERVPMAPSRARVEAGAYLFVWHLGRPFAEPLARLDAAYARALELGDFENAGYMGALGLPMHLEVGTHLRVLRRRSERLERDIGRWGSRELVLAAWMLRGLTVMLAGGEGEGEGEDDGDDSEVRTALEPEVVERRGGSRVSIYAAFANQSMVHLLLGDARAAAELTVEIIDDVERVMLGSWVVPRVALTAVVAAASVIQTAGSVRPPVYAAMRRGRRIIERWARDCPENYAHYRDLARGLQASLRGRPDAAMRSLERARSHAATQGCRWVQGLASEALAGVAEREGLAAFASGARDRAWEAYEAWGATAKLAQLVQAHPEQFRNRLQDSGLRSDKIAALEAELGPGVDSGDSGTSGTSGLFEAKQPGGYRPARRGRTRSTATNSESLDFESVLRAVRVMAEDLRLDEVVARVLDAAITNAGADRGVLLLERDGVMGVVAEATVDGERHIFETPVALTSATTLCPTSLVNFVVRTEQALVLDDARTDPRFADDAYVVQTEVQSLLGLPILKAKRSVGALVLENRLSAYCFSPERLEGLELIAGQAASALDNARLYAALRRSEARWRSLVDGAPDIIALLNERGEVEFINRARLASRARAPLAHAASGAETHGKIPFERLLGAASVEGWRAAVSGVLREGVQRELELEVELEGGPPRWYVARLAPIEVEGEGEIGDGARHAVVVATDITERKIADAERHSLEAQLRQQQRLESVGTLASGVAHEINNPVQGILNYAELIADNVEQHELVHEFAGEITKESNRVARIVRNLLQFSRQEREARIEDIDIRELIETTLSLIRAVMRKDHIQITVEIPAGLPVVSCRVQQIQQIIMNLVTNARDALNERYCGYDERKVIEIRSEVVTKDPPDRRWLRLIVEDHGPGISPDVLPRIFDPFFTTKGRDQGTGLGLSVSHGIAHDHGGELSVETERGQWTRFRLDLPVAELSVEPGAHCESFARR
ncbi:protein kinase domain-containing protein [Enhygromyxa salina]|uniref:protein kinase domain-containing protein n=1 Tax=Enhygromyxa salina TaxID=215803 RepID=UPI0015E5CD64|nr:AAA family ATPase [Enhygromyxa salina]